MVTEEGVVVKNTVNDTQIRFECSLTGSSAVAALTDMITTDGLDDLLVHIPFSVQEPFIRIDPMSDKEMGESFTISGFTNISEGEELSVVISPIRSERRRFYPVDDCILKAHVRSGNEGENPWSTDVACSLKKPQEYEVLVRSGIGIVSVGKISVKWR